jgi:hypothetical protein
MIILLFRKTNQRETIVVFLSIIIIRWTPIFDMRISTIVKRVFVVMIGDTNHYDAVCMFLFRVPHIILMRSATQCFHFDIDPVGKEAIETSLLQYDNTHNTPPHGTDYSNNFSKRKWLARCLARAVFYNKYSSPEIVGSNLAWHMNACLRYIVLVLGEARSQSLTPSEKSYGKVVPVLN